MFDLHPYTLLISVFLVLVIKQTISFIGKSKIQDLGWGLYIRIGSKLGFNQFAVLNAKNAELHQVNREKKAISAQDQYAKWTKLNRQSDKLAAELKSLEEGISSNKALIDRVVGLALMILTTLPIWVFRIWFRKAVLFYLPNGVLPHYIEWFLALPFIKTGGIGLTVWMFSVNSVISSVLSIISYPFEKAIPKPVKATKVEEVKEPSPEKIDIEELK